MPRNLLLAMLFIVALLGCTTQQPPNNAPTNTQANANPPQKVAQQTAQPAASRQPPNFTIIKRLVHRAYDRAEKANQSSKSGVVFRPGYNGARHTHGGKAADLHRASFSLNNPTKKPLTINLHQLAFAKKHCRSETWPKAKTLKTTEITLDTPNTPQGNPLTIAPNATANIKWFHHAESVYQSCNHFKYQLTLKISGNTHTFDIPVRVLRMTPYRPRR